MTESTRKWFSLPMRYSTCATEGRMNLSKWLTMPPDGDRIFAMTPSGRGSPTYSASTRSRVRRIFAVIVMPRLFDRKRPRCKKAVCGTSRAFSMAE